ncbi:alpha/beta hydrolase family protein [Nocardioides sp. Iso805N]|uniref:alpha/beta hydrolase family protein n=1 Tax=Nocardioides sp. Iso805N TaxID=1283287 RepID=UPI0003761EBF|nr:alpha/beta family hydrolase [Nocardioides sp. Iso805N]
MSTQMIATPYGEGRLETRRARSTIATVLLSHGAGNGIETDDLQALASALPAQGVSVMLFEQPWRVAGRRVASPPATLDAGLTAAVDHLRTRTPLVIGGRSAGARSAARTAKGLGAAGCLALAFPLHPPGKPEKSRAQELEGAGVPTLVIQGERDPMGRPDEFPGELGSMDLVVVPGADHSLQVAKRGPLSQEEANAILVESTLEWLVRDVIGART